MLLRHGTASRAWLNPLSLLDLNPLCGETSLAHVGGGWELSWLTGSRWTPGWNGAGAKPPPLCRDALRRKRSTAASTLSCGGKRRLCSGSGEQNGTCNGSWSWLPRERCVSAGWRVLSAPGLSWAGHVCARCCLCHLWERCLSTGAFVPSPECLEQAVPPVSGPRRCRLSELAG